MEERLELILGSHSFVWMQYLWLLCSGRGSSSVRNSYQRALFQRKRATFYLFKERCFQLCSILLHFTAAMGQGHPTCQVLKL